MAQFERWYAAYPLHKARGAGEAAFLWAIQQVDLGVLIEGAVAYAAEVRGWPREKIAHPSTWLRAKRWADERAPGAGVREHFVREPEDPEVARARQEAYGRKLREAAGIE